jgi:predicted secreted protein
MVSVCFRYNRYFPCRPDFRGFTLNVLMTGDWYPERNVFQILIAICSGPRFALILLWYLLTYRRGTALPKVVAAIGVLRTFLCGGWVYVTSTDDHGFHDITMIGYLLCTLPWTVGVISMSPMNPRALKYRKILAGAFFGTLVPLIYYFIQHKVHKVPGGSPRSPVHPPIPSLFPHLSLP